MVRKISVVVLLIAAALIFPIHIYAAGDVASGNDCGVDWRVTSDNCLIIGAEGSVQSLSFGERIDGSEMFPWASFAGSIKSVRFSGTVRGYGDLSGMFESLNQLENIDFKGFDTSETTSMFNMFFGCSNLKTVDMSGLDTKNVTNMQGMFWNCKNLVSADMAGLDARNVEVMKALFYNCRSLRDINLSGIRTGNLIEIDNMFNKCSKVVKLDLSGIKTDKVTEMEGLFNECTSLKELNIDGFKTSNVRSMDFMFYGCRNLRIINCSRFDTAKAEDMDSMFGGCSGLTSLDLSNFDTGNVRSMWSMFEGCSKLSELDLSSFNTSRVTVMASMFKGCSKLKTLDLSGFDTGKTERVDEMFEGCSNLTFLDISSFDLSKKRILFEETQYIWDPVNTDNMLTGTNIDEIRTPLKLYGSVALPYLMEDMNNKYFTALPQSKDKSITLKRVKKLRKLKTPTLTAEKTRLTVRWKKAAYKITGYEIQYCTSKDFKSGKKTLVVNGSKTSKKISKLKSGKKYYIRMRAYRKYNNKKYYSYWSRLKAVTTKKK